MRMFRRMLGTRMLRGTHRLAGLVLRYGLRQVRGIGLMWGIDVMGTAAHVVSEALGRGLLVCSAGDYTVRMVPPLVSTQEELHRGLQILEEVL